MLTSPIPIPVFRRLKDFNLEVGKGEKIAIIGRTGSGKTTLAQLIHEVL